MLTAAVSAVNAEAGSKPRSVSNGERVFANALNREIGHHGQNRGQGLLTIHHLIGDFCEQQRTGGDAGEGQQHTQFVPLSHESRRTGGLRDRPVI